MNCYSSRSISLFGFFFFKQKTAYELRISDWSSDVCSSDLTPSPAAAATAPHLDPFASYPPAYEERYQASRTQEILVVRNPALTSGPYRQQHEQYAQQETGRAARKDRACLYG